VTEGGPRVSIIVQVLGNQGTARSTHRIWAAEGWSSALVWVSAWMAQTGVAVRLLIKRERHVERHVLASGRTPLFFCLGASCPHDPLDVAGCPQKGDQGRSSVICNIDTPGFLSRLSSEVHSYLIHPPSG
jgi:hypothetical protein